MQSSWKQQQGKTLLPPGSSITFLSLNATLSKRKLLPGRDMACGRG